MIRSDKDLKLARQQIAEQQEQAGCYRASLEAEGLPVDDVERLVDLRLHFSRQLAEEITWYEQARTGYLGPTTLAGLGRFLVGLRIAHELRVRTRITLSNLKTSPSEARPDDCILC